MTEQPKRLVLHLDQRLHEKLANVSTRLGVTRPVVACTAVALGLSSAETKLEGLLNDAKSKSTVA